MKIVIDIDEEMYEDANILIVKDLPILKKIIAEGTPLIECQECEHCYFADNRILNQRTFVCELFGDLKDTHGYCSYGEIRKDGN